MATSNDSSNRFNYYVELLVSTFLVSTSDNGYLNKTDGTFHFHNNGYEYIVPCAENRFNNKLIVKKNGDVILQKEIKLEYEEN